MLKLNYYLDIKWLVIALAFTTIVMVLTHIPQELMPSQLQKKDLDKLQHIVAYGIITFLFNLSLKNSPSILSALLLFIAILAIGITDEITQPFVHRQASLSDLAADVIGIILALLLMIGTKCQRKKNDTE